MANSPFISPSRGQVASRIARRRDLRVVRSGRSDHRAEHSAPHGRARISKAQLSDKDVQVRTIRIDCYDVRTMTSNLRAIRESAGITRAALARKAGLAEGTVLRAEKGRRIAPTTANRLVIAYNALAPPGRESTLGAMFPDIEVPKPATLDT